MEKPATTDAFSLTNPHTGEIEWQTIVRVYGYHAKIIPEQPILDENEARAFGDRFISDCLQCPSAN